MWALWVGVGMFLGVGITVAVLAFSGWMDSYIEGRSQE